MMNEQERLELERLKQRQARLEQELASFASEIKLLEQRLKQEKSQTDRAKAEPLGQGGAQPPAAAVPTTWIPAPPVIALAAAKTAASTAAPLPTAAAKVGVGQPQAPALGELLKSRRVPAAPPLPPLAQSVPTTPPPAPLSVDPKLEPAGKGSFEMRLGTHWLPRVGIVLVLTGMVFFGNLAYHQFISKLGPGGKVALLYVASAALLVAGAWWQRKAASESLKNYAQVLFAGGLAAVYFTTYAAYYNDHLKIIEDRTVDGVLLLGWAGFMAWIADRRKSEVLALFAVGLAYYTSIITRVGYFTLYSNLLLTAAAVFFLVRNRWAAVSVASLIATYASYAFWRFFNGSEWHWASPDQGLWTGTYFLISYWLLFTAAAFLSKARKLVAQSRVGFLTVNNGAFFAGFVLTMLQVQTGGFWKFCLIYGSGLLALGACARSLLASEPLAKKAYLTQGLLLVTVGFIARYSGMQLALILAVESAALLISGQQLKNVVLLAGAYITAGLAVGWGIDGMRQFDRQGLWLGVGLGTLMLANTLLAHRHASLASQAADDAAGLASRCAPPTLSVLRLAPSYFAVLALAVWFVTTWNNTIRTQLPLVLAAEAVLFILSIYVLRIPEVTVFGQGYLLLAQLIWIYDAFAGTALAPGWSLVAMILIAMGISYWSQQQNAVSLRVQMDADLQALDKLLVLGKDLVLVGAMQVAVTLAGGWSMDRIIQPNAVFYLPIGIGALLLADALLSHRQRANAAGPTFRLQPAYSTALALVVWLAVTWHATDRAQFPLVLAAEALALTLSFHLLSVPEIPVLSQAYTVLAQVAWLAYFVLEPGRLPPWWNPVLLIAVTLALGHWWQRRDAPELRMQFGLVCQGLYALAIVGVLYSWLAPRTELPAWLALTSLLAVVVTAYGVLTRAWLLALAGQIFLLVSCILFATQLVQGKPHWPMPLAPIAALALLSFSTVKWFQGRPDPSGRVSEPLLHTAFAYRWVALAMSIWWVCQYIPEQERIWVLALLGLVVFGWAGWQQNREALFFSAAYTVVALALFWLPLPETSPVYWPNLAMILILLAQGQIVGRLPQRYPLRPEVHGAVIVIGGLSLWRFLSLWVLEQQPGGFYLTASWSLLALALFAAGIGLRERMYRWLGLSILGCALGRVMIVDVWKLETLYRILSFTALGVVLLVLGFIYNKYQEKIREWL
jgi:uncharacterized membrane protein